jgi:flagellar hook assembly protein FlgD
LVPLLDQTDNRLAYTTLQWNGRGSAGENLPAGAYIISLVKNGKEVETLRVVKSER